MLIYITWSPEDLANATPISLGWAHSPVCYLHLSGVVIRHLPSQQGLYSLTRYVLRKGLGPLHSYSFRMGLEPETSYTREGSGFLGIVLLK